LQARLTSDAVNLLHEALRDRARAWRETGHANDAFPAVAEIFEWIEEPGSGAVRYLRRPQIDALEVYWLLRLVEGTPQVAEFYRSLFPKPSELLTALGIVDDRLREIALDEGADSLLLRIRTDDELVRDFRLEAVRETLTLSYPSYVFALAMGAGKTTLIGAIAATEFALAVEYPEDDFVENALVFAPGKTILESLRELATIPYDRILPPRLFKTFSASVKLTFTRDGEKDLPIIRGSSFNLVVTNTEKIRIQKETIRKSDLAGMYFEEALEEAKREVANLRLQALASLPRLAIFSDEAHHTYGQALDRDLKKVRKTVDYLAAETDVACVVNTTGTPYFQRQPLRDVVIWYGLSQGIRDGILKDLAGNIQSFEFEDDAAAYVRHVVLDFFKDYGDVRLPDGSSAKLAIYFPQTDDLAELRPVVDRALAEAGLGPEVALVNTSDSSLTRPADVEAFNRLNDPASPHRVVLLVNKGTEGWNCPSLFACALARKLRSSNNFVLQAATRCLRQVPGNDSRARIYLSEDNRSILDRQLEETYGENLAALNRAAQESRRARIVLRKPDLPPLLVTIEVQRVIPKARTKSPLKLEKPTQSRTSLSKRTLTVAEAPLSGGVLRQVGDSVELLVEQEVLDARSAAVELAATYRLEVLDLLGPLSEIYPDGIVPEPDLSALARQIEGWQAGYEVRYEQVDVALALVKAAGFERSIDADGNEIWTAEIVYPKDRERLILERRELVELDPLDRSFHYEPYDFDSRPELSFFDQMLRQLGVPEADVEDFLFTGALQDPEKTDFHVEYKDDKGKWRRYTPDFVIRRKPVAGGAPGAGKVCLVEIKRSHDREHPVDGENGSKAKAVRRWETLNPNRLRYEMIFVDGSDVPADRLAPVREFAEESKS
jgi:type III restriction enzyme